jgi:hypothetical protein
MIGFAAAMLLEHAARQGGTISHNARETIDDPSSH